MEEKLIAVVAAALDVPASSLTLDSRLGDVEAWDSLAQINIVSEIESAFGAEIPIEEIGSIETVRDFLRWLGERA